MNNDNLNTLQVPVEDIRSRTNSLRNGETSKVIQNVDIEAPKMNQEELEEYLLFCARRKQTV